MNHSDLKYKKKKKNRLSSRWAACVGSFSLDLKKKKNVKRNGNRPGPVEGNWFRKVAKKIACKESLEE